MNPWTPLPKIFAGFLRRDCNESHQSHLLPDGTGRTPGRPAGASLLEPEIFCSCAELGPVFAKKSIQRVLIVTDQGILRSGIAGAVRRNRRFQIRSGHSGPERPDGLSLPFGGPSVSQHSRHGGPRRERSQSSLPCPASDGKGGAGRLLPSVCGSRGSTSRKSSNLRLR